MIVRSYPETGLHSAQLAWFESDAPTNLEALKEIDTAASVYGLVRTKEYWLATSRLPDGRVVRKGICYRPEMSDMPERLSILRGEKPEGLSSTDIVRSLRDGG